MPHRLALLSLLAAMLLAFSGSAAAHASQNSADGKIRVTWGWLEEPAHAGEKLKLDLVIRDNANGAGISGLTGANITILTLGYGEKEYALGNLTAYNGPKGGAFAGPGSYTASISVIPTREGIYTLHIKGTVNGSAVDLEIPAQHALEYPDALAFPDPLPTNEALEARVAALEAKAQAQSQTPAPLTKQAPSGNSIPLVGMLGVLAVCGLVALARRQK